MKKVIVIALLFMTIPVLGMDYFKSLFYMPLISIATTKAAVQPVIKVNKPLIATIVINDQIDFFKVMQALIDASKDTQINAILLTIDNAGGAVTHFSAVHDLIKRITSIKPVVALVTGSACSGGYLIASACNYIICQSCSDLGAIGVIWDFSKYTDTRTSGGNLDAKLEVEVFHEGDFKAMFHPHKARTDDEKQFIKDYNTKVYHRFISLVAQNRNLSVENHKEWADGKLIFAPEALRLGLVDEIGTIFEAEAKLNELIGTRNPDIIFEKDITYKALLS